MRPLGQPGPWRPNVVVEAEQGRESREWMEAIRGHGGRDKVVEAEMRLLRPNGAVEAK